MTADHVMCTAAAETCCGGIRIHHKFNSYIDVCGKKGITLNSGKFMVFEDTVEFASFDISLNSVRPCGRYLVISDFTALQNITDIQSWFGLVNQVSYTFSVTNKMLPFRQLLKLGNAFY